MSTETGWIVERTIGNQAHWMAVSQTAETGLFWTVDSWEAIRFCRKEDADALRFLYNFHDAVATEHQWTNPEGK